MPDINAILRKSLEYNGTKRKPCKLISMMKYGKQSRLDPQNSSKTLQAHQWSNPVPMTWLTQAVENHPDS